MSNSPSRNGKPAPQSRLAGASTTTPEASRSQPVKNEIDLRLDKLNELWRAAEGKLLGMQPPREIAFGYHDLTDEDGDVVGDHMLGIRRIGGKWRIVHATRWGDADPAELEWKPITDCTLELRMLAAESIDRLTFHVKLTGEEFIPDLDKAIGKLEAMVLGKVNDDGESDD